MGDKPKGEPEVDSKSLDLFALVWVLQNQTLKQGFESQQNWEVTPRSTDGGRGDIRLEEEMPLQCVCEQVTTGGDLRLTHLGRRMYSSINFHVLLDESNS